MGWREPRCLGRIFIFSVLLPPLSLISLPVLNKYKYFIGLEKYLIHSIHISSLDLCLWHKVELPKKEQKKETKS